MRNFLLLVGALALGSSFAHAQSLQTDPQGVLPLDLSSRALATTPARSGALADCADGFELAQNTATTALGAGNTVVTGGLAQELGQSITAPCTGVMDSLFVVFQPRPGTTGEQTTGNLTVYSGAGTAGALLATVPFSFAMPQEGFAYTLEFDISDVEVTEGEVYTYFIDLDGTSSMGIHASAANPYAGGTVFVSTSTTPAGAGPVSTHDLRFFMVFAAPAVEPPPGPDPGSLIITGVADGPLPGGLPKALELYVVNDIADLSQYRLTAYFNGNTTPSGNSHFVLPDTSATAGSFIHISTPGDGVAAFESFFGFAPDYSSGMINVNGDDAIRLFVDANSDGTFGDDEIADVFGVVGEDGTGMPWEYLDGWAYRVNSTGPDSTGFVLSNWTFSGVDGLEGGTTNATTNVPFPIESYVRNLVAADPTPMADAILMVANPVTGMATVRYAVPTAEVASLALYSVTGRRVATLAEGAITGTATLDARGLAAGVYVLRLEAGGQVLTRLVTVVR